MADNDIASNFSNLPLETLISAPLVAASNANLLLANATYDFIRNVWFEGEGTGKAKTKLLSFDLTRTGDDGKSITETVNAPLAALLETPNLMVSSIDVDFTMEVKDVSTAKVDLGAKTDLTASAGWGWWSAKLTGSITASSSQSRSTDRSAKYEVRVRAEQANQTEGMSRLAQIFASAVDSRA